MEKQEILEKSRRENRKGDERERTIRMEGESFSLLFVFLMGLILLTWKRVHGLPHEDVLTMFWTACVANRPCSGRPAWPTGSTGWPGGGIPPTS